MCLLLLKLVGSREIVHCAIWWMCTVQDPIKEALPMRLSTSSRSPSPDSQVTFLPKQIKICFENGADLDYFRKKSHLTVR